MKSASISIVLPDPKYRDSFMSGAREFQRTPGARSEDRCFDRWTLRETDAEFRAYVKRLLDSRSRFGVEPGPDSFITWWIVDSDGWAGEVCLDHPESDEVNVSSIVRPSKRGRGYAGQALRQVLDKAAAMGCDFVSIAADDDNAPSIRIIETACGEYGGELLRQTEEKGKTVLHYRLRARKNVRA